MATRYKIPAFAHYIYEQTTDRRSSVVQKATSGVSLQKSLPNGKKRRLVHPWNRLDLGIHASLHFCRLTPEVATNHCKGKPVKPLAP
jgi:hypothetical protein